jgi:quercetin dioxygenase-like cupin family protein
VLDLGGVAGPSDFLCLVPPGDRITDNPDNTITILLTLVRDMLQIDRTAAWFCRKHQSQIGREIFLKNAHCLQRKGLLIAFLLLVGAMSAQPQDVVKASPETHSVLLENAQVRVLDVHVKPGETVAMHSHPAGILYYLSDAKLKITYADRRTAERAVKAGTAVWSEAVTHAAENIGTTELHEVQTELRETVKTSEPTKKIDKSPM